MINRILNIILLRILLTSSNFLLGEEVSSNESFLQETPKKYKIIFFSSGAGELEWSKRLENICEKLQYEIKVLNPNPSNALKIINEFQPDFTVGLSKDPLVSGIIPSYWALTCAGTSRDFFDKDFKPNNKMPLYDGYLFLSHQSEINSLKSFIESSGKKFNGIEWYPSCMATEYQPITPTKLFYCGFQWDPKRRGREYQKMFTLLDQKGYLNVYGPNNQWKFIPNSWKRLLPYDGVSVCNAIREAGIALVLHSDLHLNLGVITSRIFEAASACSTIISDRHSFILSEFGDSVLYIDTDVSGVEIFNQIETHIQWIFNHPDEAEKMARKAHEIFLQKFTLEDQMKNLVQMHEAYLKQ